MQIYGISSIRGMGQTVRLGEGLPDLLALGHRSEVLPVFGSDAALKGFVESHPSTRLEPLTSTETTLLGTDLFEVAETLYPAAEVGGVELVVFDPVLDADGTWIGEAFSWRAESFCAFMTTVVEIARRQEGVPDDRRPSPRALRKALIWYMLRMLLYRLDLLRHFDSLRRILSLKD
jgi:hypothetical protein